MAAQYLTAAITKLDQEKVRNPNSAPMSRNTWTIIVGQKIGVGCSEADKQDWLVIDIFR